LGKAADGQDIPPVELEVRDADIEAVGAILKDPEKRKKFLYNDDNSINLKNLTDLLVKNQILESAVKAAYADGGTREVEKFQKLFPNGNPHDVGVGGKNGNQNSGQKGKFVSVGKPEVANGR
jgi:hypothetical protein